MDKVYERRDAGLLKMVNKAGKDAKGGRWVILKKDPEDFQAKRQLAKTPKVAPARRRRVQRVRGWVNYY